MYILFRFVAHMRSVMASVLVLYAWNAAVVSTRMIDVVSLLVVHTLV
jgi:hypothetical protein